MIKKFILGLGLFLLITGCTAPEIETPLISPSSIPATATPNPIDTSIVTTTPLPTFTEINTSSMNPSVTPNSMVLREKCVSVSPLENTTFLDSGSLIYYSREFQGIVYVSHSIDKPRLLYSNVQSFSISPNDVTLAWRESGSSWHFQDNNGHRIFEVKDEMTTLRQWLKDDRVVFGVSNSKVNEYPYEAKDEFYVLSIETGQITHTMLTMPGYFATGISGYLGPFTPIYNPQLNYSIYAWSDPETTTDGMLLWDLKRENIIWKKGEFSWKSTDTVIPSWNPTGTQVVIQGLMPKGNSTPELISVSITGEEKQLTHFGDLTDELYLLYSPKWSPDGRYIAFLYDKEHIFPLQDRYLYVLDTQTGFVSDYCIASVFDYYWSPNSKQIASFLYGESKMVIIDIEDGTGKSVKNVAEILGWIKSNVP